MATAAHLREMLLKASDYKERKEAAGDDPLKRPAFDMKLEALIPVLNREIPLKAHAHQANDILTAIRIAKEFHVKLTLEHTTEGNLIVDELVKAGYPCAVGPSLGHATKFELQNDLLWRSVRWNQSSRSGTDRWKADREYFRPAVIFVIHNRRIGWRWMPVPMKTTSLSAACSQSMME